MTNRLDLQVNRGVTGSGKLRSSHPARAAALARLAELVATKHLRVPDSNLEGGAGLAILAGLNLRWLPTDQSPGLLTLDDLVRLLGFDPSP
jgi:hypothetical protein